MELVRYVSGSIPVLKKPGGGGEICIQSSRGFFCANVHFNAKPRKVIRKEGDPSLDVGTGFKNKCLIIYIEYA